MRPLSIVSCLLFALLPPLASTAAEGVSFNRDIRPILTKNCTACHGGVKAAGQMSFVYKEKAMGTGKSGKFAIVPGKPQESELIKRIVSQDPDEIMPKPDHGPPLTKDQVAKLTAWIASGAQWDEHWSFLPPVEPALPKVNDPSWVKLPMDQFLLARLENEGLKPSPAAGAAEWFRRASLDLTGLPPTWEEWKMVEAAWAKDPAKAKAEAVDRLLASPHYGERWASLWLDLARYADTQGFEKDLERTVWPYRDWVIRSFNADMPFADFTVRQLAGDLLEKPDLVATAFHRNTWTNTEGGTDDEEYRVAAVIDRVATTWTAWQATTFGCVQCHSHPYDPIPHEDFYKFMAFFNSTEDADLNNEFPKVKAANDPAQQENCDRQTLRVREMRSSLNEAAVAEAAQIKDWKVLQAIEMKPSAKTGTLRQDEAGVIHAGGTNPTQSNYALRFPGQSVAAIRLKLIPVQDDPKQWLELASVLSQVTVAVVSADGKKRDVPLSEVVADFLAGPFDPQDSLNPNGEGFGPYPSMQGPRWCVIVPKAPITTVEGETLEIVLTHKVSCNGDNQPSILRKFSLEASSDDRLVKSINAPARAEAWKAYSQEKKQLDSIAGTSLPGLLQRSKNAALTTRVFTRGNRMTRDAEVTTGIPVIARPPAVKNPTRLDMAKWLVGEQNTLTARVLANRLWAELFGIGIVETQEDFGSSGLPPTHPELLDHLALRLSKHHGWHLKPFLKELVLSAAYGQQNKAGTEIAKRDPRNKLLSHGPRTRLTAEMVRDQNLLVSGLLSRKQFGPPVFPPQPEGVWRSVYNGSQWKTSTGEDRYRRGLYTYWKRTSAYPSFITFDMSSRDICTARRISTNTPLQALVTLNDPAYLEMAQALAKRCIASGADLKAQLKFVHEQLLLTTPNEKTLATLSSLHADSVVQFQKDPAAMKLLGASPEEAAMVIVANTLMNTDVALSK